MVDLKGKDFLKLLDFTSEEIGYLIDLAADLKAKKKAGIAHRIHEIHRIIVYLNMVCNDYVLMFFCLKICVRTP